MGAAAASATADITDDDQNPTLAEVTPLEASLQANTSFHKYDATAGGKPLASMVTIP